MKIKSKIVDTSKIQFVLLGALIGAAVGFLISIFRFTVEKCLELFKHLFHLSQTQPLYLGIIAVLFFLLFLATRKMIQKEPMIKGSGIPQIEAELTGELSMNIESVFLRKFVGGILAIGSGLFLGREGPSIQLGALVGAFFSKKRHSSLADKKAFISSGAAAGLSAAFNAPIAGLLFILEEVHHTFTPIVWITSFIASLVANFISINFFGLTPILHMEVETLPVALYPILLIFGIFSGLLARLYQMNLLALPSIFRKIPGLKPKNYAFPVLLILLVIGFFFPNLIGGGNTIILGLSDSHFSLLVLLGILFLRYFFSMASYGTGLPGGIFLPILTIGALWGLLFARGLTGLHLMSDEYLNNFIILGMSAYFGGISKAPLTSMILVCEMVGDLHQMMALGVVTFFSYIIVDFLGGSPIYEALLEAMHLSKNKLKAIEGKMISFEYPVDVGSFLDGKMIREIPFPKEVLVTTLRRGDKKVFVHGDTLLRVGDKITILSDSAHEKAIRELATYWAMHED